MALDNVTFASMVSDLASQEYKDRVPVATQDNIGNIEEIISTYPTAKNEFISVLTNQVAKQLFLVKLMKIRISYLTEVCYHMVNQ